MNQEAENIEKSEHIDAHRFSSRNRKQLEESSECGCFKCLRIFSPKEISLWWEEPPPLMPTSYLAPLLHAHIAE